MKKVTVSMLLLGLTVSAHSVFAEDVKVEAVSGNTAPTATMYTTTANSAATEVVVPQAPEVTAVPPVVEKDEVVKLNNLDKMKARGAQLIKERVNSLNVNAQAIANSKNLTAEQKAAFANFFAGKITDLNTLAGKIASSTDASTTKALVSSIFTDYRIYGVLIPQLRLEKRLYELQAHATKLNDVFAKVQTRIDAHKAKGKDVTEWQKNLDDTKAMVATDTTKIQTLLVQINALQPSSYGTTSKSVIESVSRDTRAIARDFQSVNKKVMKPYYLRNIKNSAGTVVTASTTPR